MHFWCKIIKIDTFIQSTGKWTWTLKILRKERQQHNLQRTSVDNTFLFFFFLTQGTPNVETRHTQRQ